MDTVFTKIYGADVLPPVDRREVLRYMGGKKDDAAVLALIEECEAEALPQLSYKACYCRCERDFFPAESRDLAKNLAGCCFAFVFAATVGLGIDRLIARYGRISPLKALCFQAVGAERIEALCNFFHGELRRELAESGLSARPRFSPGYGDLPLSFQREIFSLLDCRRKIGLSLNDSLLMSPSKSVTAVVGVARNAAARGCREAQGTAARGGREAQGTAARGGREAQGTAARDEAERGPAARDENPCLSCGKTDCIFRR